MEPNQRMMNDPSNQPLLVGKLRETLQAQCAGETVDCVETHISYVLLTKTHAYKIKKAVNLGFLDFRSLARRRAFCERELKLNRRFSSKMYESVVPVCGTPEQPQWGGMGEPIEFALKMRAFPQACRADMLLHQGLFGCGEVDKLAQLLAANHQFGASSSLAEYGSREIVASQLAQVGARLCDLARLTEHGAHASWLTTWCADEVERHADEMERRRASGYVRDCHGDLHLANMVLQHGELSFFDCIEFDDTLRFIDVLNDLAFPVMDLQARGRSDLSWRLLNAYLERTGDYAGLLLLPLYVVYRAMIRAQVALLQREAEPGDGATQGAPSCGDYLQVALCWARPAAPFLILMHGFSGSGKTTISQEILQRCTAVRLRSDVERKRLQQQGRMAAAPKPAELADPYSDDFTVATYGHLLRLAEVLLLAGYRVVVDACFLLMAQRFAFRQLAASRKVFFEIVDVRAGESLMRERIRKRLAAGSDASEADLQVLEHQLKHHQPFAADELLKVAVYESETGAMPSAWGARRLCENLLERLGN
jgi:aminoglycoside phosphotransferase family enzyme/predicted kinase